MKKLITIASLLIVSQIAAFGQRADPKTFGWDLTYKTILDSNNVAANEWIRKWLGVTGESPAKGWMANWKYDAIDSSILMEFPAFHAGERITMWFARTAGQAYQVEFVNANRQHETTELIDAETYDKMFATMSPWQQLKPLSADELPEQAPPGYMGFLSFYNRGDARQMLLTVEDFVHCDTKKCEHFSPGRVAQALMVLPDVQKAIARSQHTDKADIDKFISNQAKAEAGEEYPDARKVVTGDLSGDGIAETAVVYTIEGQDGTNNHIQYLAVFKRVDEQLVPITHVSVGGKNYRDVDLEEIVNGLIKLTTTSYKKTDPSCCPTLKGSARYRLLRGKLVAVSRRR